MLPTKTRNLVLALTLGATLTGCAWFNRQAEGVPVMPHSGVWDFTPSGSASANWKVLADNSGKVTIKLTFNEAKTLKAEIPNPAGATSTTRGEGTWDAGRCTFKLNRPGNEYSPTARDYEFKLVILSETKLTGDVLVQRIDMSNQERFDGRDTKTSSSMNFSLPFVVDQSVTGTLR